MATNTKPKRLKKAAKPKKPKVSASITVWENYYARLKKWEEAEALKDKNHDKAVKEWEANKKRKKALVSGASKTKKGR